MKTSKKLLASQVNSVRPYKSRSKRPCDFCRRRKTCCIIENSIPCMACAQFNKGQCTFLEQPLKRSKRSSTSEKERTTKPRRTSKTTSVLEVSRDNEHEHEQSSYPGSHCSPVLAFPSDLKTEPTRGTASHMSRLGFPQAGISSWQQVMDQTRSHSTGSIHAQQISASQAHARGMLYASPLEPVQAQIPESQAIHQELVEDYPLYAMQQQQQQQPQMSPLRHTSLPQPRELEQLESQLVGQHQSNSPYYYYGAASEPQAQLDNSEFMSSASGSISSSRLSTSMWSPQTLDTGTSVMDNTELAEAGNELAFQIGTKLLPSQQTQPFQLGSQPTYYCQDTYSNFNNGGFFGGPSAVIPAQNNAFSPNHMK